MRQLLIVSAVLVGLGLIIPAGARNPAVLYSVRFSVTGIPHGGPVKGASFRLSGKGIRAVEAGPQGATVKTISEDRGAKMGGSPAITVLLEAGEYQVKFMHPMYDSEIYSLTVPKPGAEELTELDLVFQIRLKREHRTHRIVAVVEGEKDGGASSRLRGAKVSLWTEDRFGDSANQTLDTNLAGMAVLDTPLASIGDVVMVRAEADGYAPQEQQIVLGDSPLTLLSDNADVLRMVSGNPVFSSLLDLGEVWQRYVDGVQFRLRKGKPGEPKPKPKAKSASFVFEAIDSDTNKPIPNALVRLERLPSGALAGQEKTNVKGQTGGFNLTATNVRQGVSYRIVVTADGYPAKMSDIPDELIELGESRTYVVHLSKKGGPRDSWTAAERAAYDRFLAWAKQRPPHRQPPTNRLVIQDTYISVEWTDKNTTGDGPPYFDGRVSIKYLPHKPGELIQPGVNVPRIAPDPNRPQQKNAQVDGNPAKLNHGAKGGYANWYQGWFEVTASYSSPWLIRPTEEEVMRIAKLVSSIIGDPGK